MCGIAGVVRLTDGNQPPDRAALLRMAAALEHRGPDELGLYRDERAGLAHTRLSIIDLATGQQPLTNEDETLWLVFNGEIFNYLELRAELLALGHRFRTHSDSEVIVHAYEAWGEDAFARMNGQWAVALWDARAGKLVLSRDRMGVRPLYLCEHAGTLYFASEIKAIFAANPELPRRLDPYGLEQTFTFWTVVAPTTAFAGVQELEPGFVRSYQDGQQHERRYWQASYAERDGAHAFEGTLDDAVVAVEAALRKAVELRMLRADVPVGSYLSGGLDSSLIAALGRRFAGDRFHTFSMRFEDAEYDETRFQQQMVSRLGSDHHEIVVSRDQIAHAFRDVVHHAERPLLRMAPAPLFLLSKLVREHGIKVVLTGEGADEMFGGYDLFREGKLRRFWARQPESRLRPRLLERLYPYLARSPVAQRELARQFFGRGLEHAAEPGFAHQTRWQGTAALQRFLRADYRAPAGMAVAELLADLPPEFARWGPLAQDQHLEIRTLMSGYLLSAQGDRMLMAHSVEGRFPFLDKDVIALAQSLPDSFKLRVLDEKHVLKRAARDWVPAEIIERTKQPYRSPDALAFTGGHVPEYVADALSESRVAAAGVFEPRAVAQLWRKCRARAGDAQFSNADNMALIGVLSTQLLHERFVAARPYAEPVLELRTDVDRCLRRNR